MAGGFNPVPEAEPDDGLLDVLLVKKGASLLQVAAVIGKYQKGKYADYPALIRHERCTALTIRCDSESVVNIDGEALYTDALDISLVPKALRFFCEGAYVPQRQSITRKTRRRQPVCVFFARTQRILKGHRIL